MKQNFKKLFAVCAAVTAVIAMSALSASAAGEDLKVTPETDGKTVTVQLASGKDVSGQTTIILLKGDYTVGDKTTVADEDIIYINQDSAEVAKASFLADKGVLPKEDLVQDQTYTVKVADASGKFILDEVFTFGQSAAEDILYGDVDDSGRVNTTDANLVLRLATRDTTVVFTEKQQLAADVDLSGRINTTDANLILRVATRDTTVTLPYIK